MRNLLNLLITTFLLAFIGTEIASARPPKPAPTPANVFSAAGGLYYLSNRSTNVPSPFPSHLNGFVARIPWKSVEPRQNTFDWTIVDSAFNNIPGGKKVVIDIQTGVFSPDWALDKYEADGTGTFSSIWWRPSSAGSQNTVNNPSHSIVACATFEFPIPWDLDYQDDLKALVSAFAVHVSTISNNAALVRIWANPITEDTGDEEFLMSRTSLTTITCRANVNNSICGDNPTSCTPPLDTAAWQAIGYTPYEVIAAWNTMVQYYDQAFPNTIVSAAFTDGLFPPIDNHGNLTGQTDDTTLKTTLIANGKSLVREFIPQSNGAQYPLAPHETFIFNTGGEFGLQETQDNSANFLRLLNYVQQQNFCYFEVYPNDAENPKYASAEASASATMCQ
jgi:hypothetical protein